MADQYWMYSWNPRDNSCRTCSSPRKKFRRKRLGYCSEYHTGTKGWNLTEQHQNSKSWYRRETEYNSIQSVHNKKQQYTEKCKNCDTYTVSCNRCTGAADHKWAETPELICTEKTVNGAAIKKKYTEKHTVCEYTKSAVPADTAVCFPEPGR